MTVPNDQLQRLSTLVDLFEKCAKMGGTHPFKRVQQIVGEELQECLDDIQGVPEEDRAKNEPLPNQLPGQPPHQSPAAAPSPSLRPTSFVRPDPREVNASPDEGLVDEPRPPAEIEPEIVNPPVEDAELQPGSAPRAEAPPVHRRI